MIGTNALSIAIPNGLDNALRLASWNLRSRVVCVRFEGAPQCRMRLISKRQGDRLIVFEMLAIEY